MKGHTVFPAIVEDSHLLFSILTEDGIAASAEPVSGIKRLRQGLERTDRLRVKTADEKTAFRILQICKAGFAGPGMGVIKIRTVVQRSAFKYDCVALFTDNGGSQRPDCGQVRVVIGSGKRHAVDILRVLLDPGGRDSHSFDICG